MKSRPKLAASSPPSWLGMANSSRKVMRSFASSRSRTAVTQRAMRATPTHAVQRSQGGPLAAPSRTWIRAAPARVATVALDLPTRLAWALVLTSLLLDALLVGQHALVRYQSYHADAFDLGNMDQAVWNTLH